MKAQTAKKLRQSVRVNYPKTTIYDFRFIPSGYGHYKVTYTSPTTCKEWTAVINDMTIIDETKNADEPKRSDLERLKRIVKYRATR